MSGKRRQGGGRIRRRRRRRKRRRRRGGGGGKRKWMVGKGEGSSMIRGPGRKEKRESKREREEEVWNSMSCNGNEQRTRAYMVRIDTVTRVSISIDLSRADSSGALRRRHDSLAKDEKGVLPSLVATCICSDARARARLPT